MTASRGVNRNSPWLMESQRRSRTCTEFVRVRVQLRSIVLWVTA